MTKRFQGKEKLKLSWCQKEKWDQGWLEDWFYIKTSGLKQTFDDGTEDTVYPLGSIMTEMSPRCRMDPPRKKSASRKKCDATFALACCYSGGRDLMEEMVAANYWPLGKRNDPFKIEMVQVPVFGPPEGVPFPRFGKKLSDVDDVTTLVAGVEEVVESIVGPMTRRSTFPESRPRAQCLG
jgi:hypothetical protein